MSLNGSFGGGASSAQWSGGFGSFTDIDILNPVYTPSLDDINAGSVTLTLTTDDPIGPCPANSSDIIVTINPGVIVDAGPDETICSNFDSTTACDAFSTMTPTISHSPTTSKVPSTISSAPSAPSISSAQLIRHQMIAVAAMASALLLI